MKISRRISGIATLATLLGVVTTAGVSQANPSRHLAPGPASGAAAQLPPTGRVLQRWVSANMTGWSGTQAQAVAVAQSYDVIVTGTAGAMSGYLQAMHQANPQLVVLGYLNGTFAGRSGGHNFPSSWYLRDARGRKVTSTGYGNYTMDPANTGWVATRVAACTAAIGRGFDGCMIDMLGSAPTQPGYLTGLPMDTVTHSPYTAAEWVSATANIGATVARAVAPKIVVGNGLGSGPRFFNPTGPSSALFSDGLPSAISESWMKTAGSSAASYPSATQWKQNVDELVAAGAQGDAVLTITKTWGGGTQAQIDAWHRFSLASFLLGANGSDYYSFSSANTPAGTVYDSPWEHVALGAPSGAYALAGGVYQRSFANGVALVNPTTTPATMTLSRTMCDLDGVAQTSLTLGADGAQVLTDC